MAIQYLGTSISGLSGDTKPALSPSGSDPLITANEKGVIFIETDTNKLFQWDGDSWNELTSVGALNSGSIASGFGTINVGSSAITTSGTITAGNLIVDGDSTIVSSTNTTISDKLIELATGTTGTPTGDAGIVVERGDSANAILAWDESHDRFIVGTTGATGISTGDLTITAGDFLANNLYGTIQTVAQTAITSFGSLTGLTVLGATAFGADGTDHDVTFYGNDSGMDLRWEAGANALWAMDNARIQVGTNADLAMYHDGSNSYIQEAGTGQLFIQSADVIKIRNINGEQGINMIPDGAVELFHNGNEKLATTSTGVDITGALSTSSHIYLPDSQMLMLGTSNDLRIYHDGSNSYIDDEGTGDLYLRYYGSFRVAQNSNNELSILATVDAGVGLYYNGNEKLVTTNTGVSFKGNLVVYDSAPGQIWQASATPALDSRFNFFVATYTGAAGTNIRGNSWQHNLTQANSHGGGAIIGHDMSFAFVASVSGTGGGSDWAGVNLGRPVITLNGETVTNPTTLKIAGAPTAGTNPYAFWIGHNQGQARFDGEVHLFKDGAGLLKYHSDGTFQWSMGVDNSGGNTVNGFYLYGGTGGG